jgi:hypothetical protein
MTNATPDDDRRGPRTLSRVVVLVLALVSVAAMLFVPFSRAASLDGVPSAASGLLATVVSVAVILGALFTVSVVAMRANERFAATLRSERPTSVVIGMNRTTATAALLREGAQTPERPPGQLVFLADSEGVEVWSGGRERRMWFSAAWSDVTAVEKGQIMTPARAYAGILVGVVRPDGVRNLEVMAMRPGVGAWTSQSDVYLGDSVAALASLRRTAAGA